MKHTILIIDDDMLILNTLKKRFDTWDNNLFSARTPNEAKEILEKITPDVVLLDLLLTETDGSGGIMDYIKSQPRLANVPVLILTNLDKPELRELMLAQGAKDYIIKGSSSLDEIFNKVVRYLKPSEK